MIRHNVSKTVVSQFLNMWVETIGTGRAGRGAAVLERIFYPLVRVLFYECIVCIFVPEHIVNKV